jgi:nucleoside-diphosphate-sugar epimerase
MKLLILGCGYTGSYLARLAHRHNIAIGITTRSGQAPDGLDIPCFAFSGGSLEQSPNPLNPAALSGVTHVLSSIPPNQQGVDPVVATLLPMLEQAGLVWFGYLSTTGVYGDTQGAWVDEATPVNPGNERSQHRVAVEQAFLQAQLPTHIFRLPGIYGPGRSIFERLRAATVQRIERPGHVFCRIHVEDIVQTLWASMQQPKPGSIYNVSDDEPTEPSNLILEAAHLLGVEPPKAISFEAAEMTPMSASFWRESRRVKNEKIKTELGVRLKYPTYREGLRGILQAQEASSET